MTACRGTVVQHFLYEKQALDIKNQLDYVAIPFQKLPTSTELIATTFTTPIFYIPSFLKVSEIMKIMTFVLL